MSGGNFIYYIPLYAHLTSFTIHHNLPSHINKLPKVPWNTMGFCLSPFRNTVSYNFDSKNETSLVFFPPYLYACPIAPTFKLGESLFNTDLIAFERANTVRQACLLSNTKSQTPMFTCRLTTWYHSLWQNRSTSFEWYPVCNQMGWSPILTTALGQHQPDWPSLRA